MIKFREEKNYLKMISVLAQITTSIDPHEDIVKLTNIYYPLFVDKNGNQNTFQKSCKDPDQITDEEQILCKTLINNEGYTLNKHCKNKQNVCLQIKDEKSNQIHNKMKFLHSQCLPHEAYIMALIYIDRASKLNQKLLLNSSNVISIALGFVIIAAKFIESETEIYNKPSKPLISFSKEYQRNCSSQDCECQTVITQPPLNINKMKFIELELLSLINFEAFVSKQEYDLYQKKLNKLFSSQIRELELERRYRNTKDYLKIEESKILKRNGMDYDSQFDPFNIIRDSN
eukprot:403367337